MLYYLPANVRVSLRYFVKVKIQIENFNSFVSQRDKLVRNDKSLLDINVMMNGFVFFYKAM